jgi:hypothetical protein
MATISFNTTFDLTATSPEVIFLDTTDWAGQGIATADVNGCFKIVAPSGITVYNNTDYTNVGCDIRTATSLTSQQTIPLPLGGDGLVEAGIYTITYTQYDSNLSVYYTQVNTYTYEYVSPEICISQTADCISPQFTSTDITEYEVEGITPIKTIVHTLYYPNGSTGGGSPLVSATTVLSTGVFYNGVQTSEIEATLSYTFTDGLIVLDIIEGSKDFKVDCTYICSIYCCIRDLEQRVIAAKGVNDRLYKDLSFTFHQVMAFVGLADQAIKCGKSDDVNCYLENIQELTNCTSDCSCSGDEPDRVSGLGGLINEVVVTSGGTPIIVTPVVVGNTTTYTISLSSSFVSTVNSSYNSVVVGGTYIYSVTPVSVGNTTTYTVDAEGTIVSAGANISVTPVVANETTTYTVASDISTTKDWDATTDTITGNPTAFTLPALSVTVPATGKYLILFDANADVTGAGDCTYQFYINSVLLTTDSKKIGELGGVFQNMTLSAIENLTSGHTVEVRLTDSSIPDMTITSKGLKLIRLS